MTLSVDATQHACSIGILHAPRNLTVEFHHLIPIGWQLITGVTDPPFPGPDTDGRGTLWDDRGVWLCPTHHRNVHYWIPRMMHAIHAHGSELTPTEAFATLSSPERRRTEAKIARLALERYVTESGASLLLLTAKGQYGQI